MTLSEFDAYRPAHEPKRKKRHKRPPGKHRRVGGGTGDGTRENLLVDDVEFSESYYGRPIVKAPPWDDKISGYMFLGGAAGGSAILAYGAHRVGLEQLRRNTRITALAATGAGTVLLILDLGRPERFLHMMRTFKPSSPMNMGTWILAGFGGAAAINAVQEVDELTGHRLPLGSLLRRIIGVLQEPAAVGAALLGAPLASYTAALLGDTAVPTWNAAKDNLSYLFVSSAAMAASGVAMITTTTAQTRPARVLATMGAAGDLYFAEKLTEPMHPAEAEPLLTGTPGKKLRWAKGLAVAGGIGAALFGGNRVAAIVSGTALAAASLLTRSAVLHAGINSTKEPHRVVDPQKARLAARRAQGILDDSITTAG